MHCSANPDGQRVTTGFATRESIARQARRVVLPPAAPIPHDQFCRTIAIPDGTLRGSRYIPESDPAHAAVCQQITAGKWQRIVCVGAVQTGKSLCSILVPILRHLTVLRHPVVYSQPTMAKLHEAWAGKLKPSISESGYGGWLPVEGQGAKGSQTPKFITFRDPKTKARAGTLYLLPGGGSSESAQAAVTAAVVAVDEVDSFPDRHRVELVTKRADSYGSRGLRIYTSTVKSDVVEGEGASIILALYNESTASRLWFACPHCARWQPLEWERVRYQDANEPEAIATASYACSGCAVLWTEDDRQRALRSWRLVHSGQQVDQETGAVVGAAPLTVAFGLLWTSLDSSLRPLGQVAAEHWRASKALALGDHGPMRSFVRDQLCRPYQMTNADRPELVEGHLLNVARGSAYARGQVPPECERVVVAVDVQLRKHWWIVVGFGKNGTWFVLDWGMQSITGEMMQPTESERHLGLDRLDEMARAGFRRDDGQIVMPTCAIDAGFRPQEVRPWVARNRSRWVSAKGCGEEQVSRMVKPETGKRVAYEQGWYDVRRQENAPDKVELFVAADDILDRVAADWLNGRGNLPRDADHMIIQHLTGMRPGTKTRWEPRGKYHDLLDCLIYSRALAQYITTNRPAPVKYGNVGSTLGA